MARPKKEAKKDFVDDAIANLSKDELGDMKLESYEEYLEYNTRARALNKKLGLCRYPIKPCPTELHPKQRVVFNRTDQPTNPLAVYLRNHLIEYKETLIPGKQYDLPNCVIQYLQDKGVPVWKWYDNPDGSKETRISHQEPRFALRTVFND